MALTPEQQKQDEADYASAYGQDEQQPAEQSEDQAFGLAPPEAPAGEQPAGPGADVDDSAAGGEPAGSTPQEEAGEMASGGTDPEASPAGDASELTGETGGSADGAQDTGTAGAAATSMMLSSG